MITLSQLSAVLDGAGDVVGPGGDRLGRIGQVYLDDATGDPAWVTVRTGLFGTSETFVPLHEASASGADIQVPYDAALVHDAPRIDADGSISPQEEVELYRYYGVAGHAESAADTAGGSASEPEADAAMTRSEEELRVGTRVVESGRARLRKYVVTEQQAVTVPVSREEVRVVREPVPEADLAPVRGAALFVEEEHVFLLHEDVPAVSTQAVPVERVRVTTRTVTQEQQVSAEVRKERVELETGAPLRADTDG
jgi:uncharacterized protein (TIGR02271 family)